MEVIKFDNGLTLVMEKFFNIRSVAMGIFVKNGALNETPSENGISHFIEHMLFKGTENRSAMDIAVEMDRAGGHLNAYTTKEYTCYYTRVLDESFERAFDILADMFFNSTFAENEVERERGVINEEIDMYDDTPDDLVHENLQNAVWRSTTLGQPVLGTHETVNSINSQMLKTYMAENYCADNTVISIAGNIDYDKVRKIVEKYFGGFAAKRKKAEIVNDNIYTPSIVSCHREIEQQHICVAFKGVSQHSDDNYTMTLLNTILGGGMSSLLFQRIREERGLAYSIYSYHSAYGNSGLFTVYAGFNRENTDLVKNTIISELCNFSKNFNDEIIVKNAKQQIINSYLMGLENTSTVMTAMGRAMLLKGRVNTHEQAVSYIEKIDMDMLKSLANAVFDENNASVSLVGFKEFS